MLKSALVTGASRGIGLAIARVLAGDTLDALLAANLRSAFVVTRQSIPLLVQAGAEHGRALFVNLASIAGAYGGAGLAAYAAAKAGVIALSHSLHAELASSGVRVTALCPALVATRMTQPLGLPPGELIQPEDIAEGVRFLLRTSPSCVVPAIPFIRPGDRLFASG